LQLGIVEKQRRGLGSEGRNKASSASSLSSFLLTDDPLPLSPPLSLLEPSEPSHRQAGIHTNLQQGPSFFICIRHRAPKEEASTQPTACPSIPSPSSRCLLPAFRTVSVLARSSSLSLHRYPSLHQHYPRQQAKASTHVRRVRSSSRMQLAFPADVADQSAFYLPSLTIAPISITFRWKTTTRTMCSTWIRVPSILQVPSCPPSFLPASVPASLPHLSPSLSLLTMSASTRTLTTDLFSAPSRFCVRCRVW
jgi:hypothetical protein